MRSSTGRPATRDPSSDAPAADEPAATPDEPAATEQSQTDEPGPAASSTDGTTADNNSPPVEEFVPGIKVTTDCDSATLAWPAIRR